MSHQSWVINAKRHKTQSSSNTKQTNSFPAFSFCCLKFLLGTVHTYFFWPHSNAAEKIVTKFSKGKVRARAESLRIWELGGGNAGLRWQRCRKCWGIIYPRGHWQALKKQNKKQNKPRLHKGMETTPHKVSQRTFHHNVNISPALSRFPKMRQPHVDALSSSSEVLIQPMFNAGLSRRAGTQVLIYRLAMWQGRGSQCGKQAASSLTEVWSHSTWMRAQQVRWEQPGLDKSPVTTRQSGDKGSQVKKSSQGESLVR